MNDINKALNTEEKIQYANNFIKRLERQVDLIYNVDVYNPQALELWKRIKNETWIKPEIKEKWEKALKDKKN